MKRGLQSFRKKKHVRRNKTKWFVKRFIYKILLFSFGKNFKILNYLSFKIFDVMLILTFQSTNIYIYSLKYFDFLLKIEIQFDTTLR